MDCLAGWLAGLRGGGELGKPAISSPAGERLLWREDSRTVSPSEIPASPRLHLLKLYQFPTQDLVALFPHLLPVARGGGRDLAALRGTHLSKGNSREQRWRWGEEMICRNDWRKSGGGGRACLRSTFSWLLPTPECAVSLPSDPSGCNRIGMLGGPLCMGMRESLEGWLSRKRT